MNFADRVHRYCFNGGLLTPGPAAQRWTNISVQVGPGMLAESARWGDYRRDVAQYQTGPYLLYTTNDFWWPEIERMRTNYFPQRTDTLLTQLRSAGLYPNLSAPVFSQHGGRIPRGFSLSMTATNPIYFTTNGNDPRVAISGAVSEEASIYSGPITLNSSVLVKARTRVGTNWSALNEAVFSVNALGPQLHFTEIMYNPQGGDAFEFLELRNDGPAPLDVSGWLFEGLDYTFPAGTLLAPGQTVVLANSLNPAAFAGRYPGVSVFGYFGSKLKNDGERIAIKKHSGEIVVSVEYGDSKGWPKAADGSGYSLEVVDAFADPNAPSNWRATSFNGTPGFASSNPPASDVRLNEILSENTSAVLNGTNFPDYVELFNAGSVSASVASWSLTDDGNARKFVFPAGASIPAGGYLVVWCDTNSTAPGLHAGFNLSHNGETVSLFNSLTALAGTINSVWLLSPISTSSSTSAKRRPSVATMVSLCSFRLMKMPFNT